MTNDDTPPDCPKCGDDEWLPDGRRCDHIKPNMPPAWDKERRARWWG